VEELEEGRAWTFFTHHAHVLISLSRDPTLRLRDIASAVGVTERATATLVSELVHAGYLQRFKDGRRNRYRVNLDGGLRHQVVVGVRVGDVFAPLLPETPAPHDAATNGSLALQRLRSAR
jgi:DNA-binding Lrp family transcriptional regulator